MNRYLIKNNIKLMYRSWGNILLFVIMPVILVFCLSSAFDTLMSKYEETDMTAGYRIEGDGITQEMLDAMIDVAEENDLTLNEYPTGDPEELIQDNGLTGFIVFEDDTYTLYEDNSAKGKVLEYFVNASDCFSGVDRRKRCQHHHFVGIMGQLSEGIQEC